MDLMMLQKFHAIKRSKRHQLLDRYFLHYVTLLTCILCSSPLWFPRLFSFTTFFFFPSLQKITCFFFSSKFIFIVGNVIIIALVGEFKFFAPRSLPASEAYYDEYITRKKSIQTSSAMEEKREKEMEKSFKEISTKIFEDGGKREGKGFIEGNLGVEKERDFHHQDREDDDFSLPAEELNKRVDDFIARVNRQRMLEARQLL